MWTYVYNNKLGTENYWNENDLKQQWFCINCYSKFNVECGFNKTHKMYLSNCQLVIWNDIFKVLSRANTVYPKKYAHGFCFAVLCCDYTLTDFPISIRLTSLALCQSNDCPSASKATLMNMDKYFMWIHYERLHNHNKAKHNKTMCIFLGIYCTCPASPDTEEWGPLKAVVNHAWIR